MLRCFRGNARKFKSSPLEGTENDSTQLLMNSSVSRVFPPFSGASASHDNKRRIKKTTKLKLLDDSKGIKNMHTYYIRQRRFSNWSLQTNTIIVPIKFAKVVQKSVENLEKGRGHKMLTERMQHQHNVMQMSFLSFLKKYDSSRFNGELTARGPSKYT